MEEDQVEHLKKKQRVETTTVRQSTRAKKLSTKATLNAHQEREKEKRKELKAQIRPKLRTKNTRRKIPLCGKTLAKSASSTSLTLSTSCVIYMIENVLLFAMIVFGYNAHVQANDGKIILSWKLFIR